MQVLDYFQQVYVINLPHRQDRRREMAEQLEKIGLQWDMPGVRLFEAVRPEEPGEFPTIGARGCFLSHLGVLRDATERKLDRILIFEDDLNFRPEFSAQMPKVIEALSSTDWSIFYGGYEMMPPPQFGGDQAVLSVLPGDAIRTTHFVGFRGPAIGEIVSFLEDMLARTAGHPNGGPMHVDGAYGWFRNESPARTTLVALPQLGYQRSSSTDIHARRWFDRLPGVRHGTSWLRRVRNKTKQ
jgi:glycosyl transferase family 25